MVPRTVTLAWFGVRAASRRGVCSACARRATVTKVLPPRPVRKLNTSSGIAGSVSGEALGSWLAARRELETRGISAAVASSWGWISTRYNRCMLEHPLKTNAVTTGALCALGDILAQSYERRALRRTSASAPVHDKNEHGNDVARSDNVHGKTTRRTSSAGFERRLSGGRTDDISPEYSLLRTLRNLIFGLFVGGPLYSVWYRTLDVVSKAARVSYEPLVPAFGWFGSRFPAMTKRIESVPLLSGLFKMKKEVPKEVNPKLIVACKVIADGMVANPTFLHAYFATIGLLEGHRPREILDHTKAQFHQAWGLALAVWTPLQIINFSVMPVHFQAAFVSFFNLGWKMTLSLLYTRADAPLNEAARLLDELESEVHRLRAEITLLNLQLEDAREQIRSASPSVVNAEAPGSQHSGLRTPQHEATRQSIGLPARSESPPQRDSETCSQGTHPGSHHSPTSSATAAAELGIDRLCNSTSPTRMLDLKPQASTQSRKNIASVQGHAPSTPSIESGSHPQ